jgi:peptide/nickel transport system substrate-binding protein
MEFTTTARLYERNPYFHQVDPAGQQLPYVDRVLSQTVDPETYTLKIVAGEADLAYTFTTMEDFTLYRENEEAGNYVINLLPSFSSGEVVYFPNLSHPDPVRRELFNTAEFRRALSIAIDRDEINDVIYSGFAKPLQWTITEFSTFYQPEWGEAWAQFDPDLANSMLDALGLNERNSAGIRLTSDGNPLTIVVEYNEGTYSGAAGSVQELVSEYWGDIGIDMRLRPVATGNLAARRASMEWDVWSTKNDSGEMYATLLGGGLQGFQNRFWELWREAQADIAAGRKTLEDFEGGVLPGEEPPAEISALLDIRVDMKLTVFGSEEYTRLATDYFQVLSDNTYAIGTVGQLPFVIISRPNVGNLNDRMPPWIDWGGDLNHYGNQWYYRPE